MKVIIEIPREVKSKVLLAMGALAIDGSDIELLNKASEDAEVNAPNVIIPEEADAQEVYIAFAWLALTTVMERIDAQGSKKFQK